MTLKKGFENFHKSISQAEIRADSNMKVIDF